MKLRPNRATLVVIGVGALFAAAIPLSGATAGSRSAQRYAAPRLIHGRSATAGAAVVRGTPAVLGGKTRQGWPVVIQLSRNGRTVVSALAGLSIPCGSGSGIETPDGFRFLPIKAGRIGVRWGPDDYDPGNGELGSASGAITAKFSPDQSTVSGTWRGRATITDSAGTVTDTCDSGTVRWSAKQ